MQTIPQSNDNRFWIQNLFINDELVKPNDNPNKNLPITVEYIDIDFDPFKSLLKIGTMTKGPYNYPYVKLIRDIGTSPTEDNKNIGLACLLCVTNDKYDNIESFSIGPVIERSKKLRSFPGKLSFVGGLFEKNDITPEHTVLREFIEELGLDVYLNYDIIKYIQKNMKLQYLIFSHPLIKNIGPDGKSYESRRFNITYESRRFNITLVYCIALPDTYLSTFRSDIYQKSEVDSVSFFKGKDILKSLLINSPFEENNGWTQNASIIVIEQLNRVIKQQYYDLIKDNNDTHDKILANLLKCFIDYRITTESELRICLKLLIQQLYIVLCEPIKKPLYDPPVNIISTPDTQQDSKKPIPNPSENINKPTTSNITIDKNSNNPFKDISIKKPPIYMGYLDKLKLNFSFNKVEFTIDNIIPTTDSNHIANDIFASFCDSGCFSKDFIFTGYESNGDKNYQFKEKVFNEICYLLRDLCKYTYNNSTKVDYRLNYYLSGGNEYYNEGPEKTGWIITLSLNK